jgi:hypothetical protein
MALRRTAVSLGRLAIDTDEVSESGGPRSAPSVAMQLLAAGVPLSLLIDLTTKDGPDSAVISAFERPETTG